MKQLAKNRTYHRRSTILCRISCHSALKDLRQQKRMASTRRNYVRRIISPAEKTPNYTSKKQRLETIFFTQMFLKCLATALLLSLRQCSFLNTGEITRGPQSTSKETPNQTWKRSERERERERDLGLEIMKKQIISSGRGFRFTFWKPPDLSRETREVE